MIVGGGLGGLSLGILLARMGYDVAIFEKEKYPFHKVCGEYISNESSGFLQHLGVDLDEIGAKNINKLLLTTQNGYKLEADLKLGGIGLSRWLLDAKLAEISQKEGCELFQQTKVDRIAYSEDKFIVSYGDRSIVCKLVAGAYGKKSNIDVALRQGFVSGKQKHSENYIGVKYHVRSLGVAPDTIELHNFNGGYCGMSAIEGDKYCLCYLTTAENLRKQGSIEQMEEHILKKNPLLKVRLEELAHLYEKPVTVSNITFEKKQPVNDHILMVGDAAGTIAPLCGNGMSMSMHASLRLAGFIKGYMSGKYSRAALETLYVNDWNSTFSSRIVAGRSLQRLFGQPVLTNTAVPILGLLPGITQRLIKLTHGNSFF